MTAQFVPSRYNQQAFQHIRDRLKSQVKVISKHLEISTNKAYEFLSLIWGYKSWRQLSFFLDQIEKINLLQIEESNDQTQNPITHSRLNSLWKMSELSSFLKKFGEQKSGWYQIDYVQGLHAAMKSEAPSDFLNKAWSLDEFYDRLNEYENDFIMVKDSIAVRTGWFQGRKIISKELTDLVLSAFEYLPNSGRDLSEFNMKASDDDASEPYNSWKLECIQNEFLGFKEDNHSFEDYIKGREELDRSEPTIQGYRSNKEFTITDLYQLVKDFNSFQITAKDLFEAVALLNTVETNISIEQFCSYCQAAAHLPDNALLTLGSHYEDNPLFLIENISVCESDLGRVIACLGRFNATEFANDRNLPLVGSAADALKNNDYSYQLNYE